MNLDLGVLFDIDMSYTEVTYSKKNAKCLIFFKINLFRLFSRGTNICIFI